jgi:phosphoribosylglycinamide formyltransferase-1
MHNPIRLAILLSGGGTTLQNLLDRIAEGMLGAEIAVVVSNKVDAFGLTRARRAGIPTFVVPRKECSSKEEFSARIFRHCSDAEVDLVCMAGFLQLLQIPEAYVNRALNIHPSLIPAFCGKGYHGLAVHRAAVEMGVKISGCTVHLADNTYDTGPIVAQRVVPVLDDDTPETLAARVFAAECETYPQVIQWFAERRLEVEGRRVRVKSLSGERAASTP